MSRDSKKAPPPPRKESSPARKESGFGFRKTSSASSISSSASSTTSSAPIVSKIPVSPLKFSSNVSPAVTDGPVLRPSSNPPDLRTTPTTSTLAEPTLRPSSSEGLIRPSGSNNDLSTLKARLSISNLTHKFPQIMEQMEINLALLSRIILQIRKVVAAREAFSVALVKEWGPAMPKAKQGPSVTPKKDPSARIRSISSGVRSTPAPAPAPSPPTPSAVITRGKNPLPLLLQKMEAMEELESFQVSNFCVQCKVAVLAPLERLREVLEESKRKIEREEKERRLKFDEIKMRDELHRRKQKCLALWVNLQGMHKNRADPKKIQKFLAVIKGKFVKYHNMVNSFNATCETYYNAIPLLVQSVQKLEYERIETMRGVLRQYCLFWHQLYAEPAKEAEAMLMLIEDPSNSLHDQKEQWMEVLAQQPASAKNWDGTIKSAETPTITFDLPCLPEDLVPGFGTDPTRGPYVHKFDGVLRAVLQAQQKENVAGRKFSVDEDQRRLSRHLDKQSDDDIEPKVADGDDGEEKAVGDDAGQGDLALAIYKQMFGCEPGELGHPILAESGDEEESSSSSSEEEEDED